MRKETGIEFLADIFDNDDFSRPDLFGIARQRQLGSMDEFSQWLHEKGWSKNNTTSLWYHPDSLYQDYKFSEVYQRFLAEKIHREGEEESLPF